MSEPAETDSAVRTPVLALQYEPRDAVNSRAVRGIRWLAAGLLLSAAEPAIEALLYSYGFDARGQFLCNGSSVGALPLSRWRWLSHSSPPAGAMSGAEGWRDCLLTPVSHAALIS